ncbi:MAG: precorrin-6y C5,15-methyltransferase (decarboxylating) subunit CbiE [Synergistaceae bacterium]|jgi:precorrin-6Y C5,15-methyltransferase (decarboxylating)|nr:precorrin-6y C5,15-methyltransferase (decarboxylating) subunit CbiE [Synergistaceae bacterium]
MKHSDNKITVVSLGPGGEEWLTPAAARALREAGCVFVAERCASLVKWAGVDMETIGSLEETFSRIEARLERGIVVAVAVSGDAGVFSLLPRLGKRFPDLPIAVIPGVSSLQALCAALGETWADAEIVSVHGRQVPPPRVAGLVAHNGKTIFFCGPDRHPAWICRILADRGIDAEIAVGERLTYPDGRVTKGRPVQLADGVFDPLSLVLARNPAPLPLLANRPEDWEFLRAKVPMTRQEVRTMALDLLGLSPDSVLWDIGAGTGSVSVAGARLCPFGEVHALERSAEALDLLRANKEKFRAYNLFIHEGSAAALEDLPVPTHVFVGGSGGELRRMLAHVQGRGADIRVVVSAVTLGTLCAAFEVLGGFRGRDVLQVSVSRGKVLMGTGVGLGVGTENVVMTGQNPVTLLSAWTTGNDGENPAGPSPAPLSFNV